MDIWSSQVLIESTPMPDANMDAGGVCSTHVHRHYLVPPHCHQSISIQHGMVTIGKLIWEVHGWLVHVAIHCSSVARVQWGLSPGRQGVSSISCSGRYIDAIQKRKGNVPYCRRHGSRTTSGGQVLSLTCNSSRMRLGTAGFSLADERS